MKPRDDQRAQQPRAATRRAPAHAQGRRRPPPAPRPAPARAAGAPTPGHERRALARRGARRRKSRARSGGIARATAGARPAARAHRCAGGSSADGHDLEQQEQDEADRAEGADAAVAHDGQPMLGGRGPPSPSRQSARPSRCRPPGHELPDGHGEQRRPAAAGTAPASVDPVDGQEQRPIARPDDRKPRRRRRPEARRRARGVVARRPAGSSGSGRRDEARHGANASTF